MDSFNPVSDPRAFRNALGNFATGVAVVTARDASGAPVGITANSFASVSLNPPLVLWSPARASRRFAIFTDAQAFAIHVLAADQQALCDAFVRAAQGFGEVAWTESAEGVPMLDGCLSRLICRREAVMDAGDHAIVLGRVREAQRRQGAPLVFHGGRYGQFVATGERHPGPEAEP